MEAKGVRRFDPRVLIVLLFALGASVAQPFSAGPASAADWTSEQPAALAAEAPPAEYGDAPPQAPAPIPRGDAGQPRLSDLETHEKGTMDWDYVFGITKGVMDSGMPTAGQVILFPLTIVLDTALLPFELFAGLMA